MIGLTISKRPFSRLPFSRLVVRCASALLIVAPILLIAPAPANSQSAPVLDLAQYRGKVVYIDFWASWCGPCKLSFPWMNQLRQQYGAKDLVIVTVNVDHDRAPATAFLNSVGGTLPVIYDPQGVLATRYKVAGMPTSILIGRDGQQRFVHHGYFPNKTAEYQAHIATLVAEHP